jgi:hypothetical protein
MPLVVVTFHDGEVLYAETPELTFALPVLEAEVRNVDSNSQRALLPLGAIRQILIGDVEPAPAESVLATWDRAAFHFLDGQVLRAWIGPDVTLGQHGGIWRAVEPGSDELYSLAIPYASLKGVYQLRQWDSRPGSERAPRADGIPLHVDTMVRVLAEREARATRQRVTREGTPLLERMRRARPANETEIETEA